MIGEGDLVIVLAYHTVSEEDARSLRPRLVYVDGANRIMRVADERSPGSGAGIGGGMMRRVSIQDLKAMKQQGEKIAMLTAYDYPTARLLDEAGVPIILVGDSLGMVVLGYSRRCR